jgi:hypothetical protein
LKCEKWPPLLVGGLEPHFRVLFSAIFQGIALGHFPSAGKQWKVVETKLLQIAASPPTFCELVISARGLKLAARFWVFLSSAWQIIGQNISLHRLYFAGRIPRIQSRVLSKQQTLQVLSYEAQIEKLSGSRGQIAHLSSLGETR